MVQMREIKGRLKAVGNIERITKTMQMIATSKFQAAMRKSSATRPYTDKVAELVGQLAGASGEGLKHPLLKSPEKPTGKKLLLVLNSTRGLCGGYNGNVLRTAMKFINEQGQSNIDLESVGRKGLMYFRFNKIDVAQAHSQFDDLPTYDQVNALAEQYMKMFEAGKYDSVHICYIKFISNSRQEPDILKLLPLEKPQADKSAQKSEILYEFSPEPEELLGELLPITVKTQLFQCFNDAVVSEQISRMVAMKAATDNAGKMNKNLSRSFNRARQTQITNELIEVISGSQAV